MKKIMPVFLFSLFLLVPRQVHAGGAMVGTVVAIIAQIANKVSNVKALSGDAIYYADHLKDVATQIQHAKDQLDKLKEEGERAINNLKGVLDINSYNDFVNWTNRQLYLERQAESRFNELGVKIGKKKYKISDIDKIPEALLNDLEDRYRGDFSEEDEKAMWVSLGLSPGNYMYLKTWQERNDNIAKKIRTYAEIYADEHEEAVERNNDLIDKYSREDEKLDINEISKDANLLAMNQEMVLREILRLQIEMHEYELARDKMTESLYNPPRLSDTWGYDPWQSITSGGFSKDEYQDY